MAMLKCTKDFNVLFPLSFPATYVVENIIHTFYAMELKFTEVTIIFSKLQKQKFPPKT